MNVHKGFTTFNRRFMLHELREAVRGVAADLVFLQEVQGSHQRHAQRVANFRRCRITNFWPTRSGRNTPTGATRCMTTATTATPCCRSFPSRITKTTTSPSGAGAARHAALRPAAAGPPPAGACVCVHLGLQESHRQQQLQRVCDLINSFSGRRARGAGGRFQRLAPPRPRRAAAREAGLEEVFVHAFGRAVRTFRHRCRCWRCNRIYVRNAAVHAPLELPRKPWDSTLGPRAHWRRRFCYDPAPLCTRALPAGCRATTSSCWRTARSSSPRVRCDCQRPARGDAGDLHPV